MQTSQENQKNKFLLLVNINFRSENTKLTKVYIRKPLTSMILTVPGIPFFHLTANASLS